MKELESERSSISEREVKNKSIVKFVSPKKWKMLMIDALQGMLARNTKHKLLVTDLTTIVKGISEQSFVEATLQIRPFKPEFMETPPVLFQNRTLSTLSESVTKVAYFKNELSNYKKKYEVFLKVTEETLVKEFKSHYHPFRFILRNFRRLLELKYKSTIDNKKMNMTQVQRSLREDISILTQFMKEAALPYRKLFKSDGKKSQEEVDEKLNAFIETYISDNDKLHSVVKKILVYASRTFYQKLLEEKLSDFTDINKFGMPEEFKIDGCYIRSINSLMEFTVGNHAEESLEKLVEFRKNILTDLDEFYSDRDQGDKQLEVCAETQMEIIRFVISKLKGWSAEIYAQLKFLEVIYGEDDIAFKFEDASFIYSQISGAFQLLEIQ